MIAAEETRISIAACDLVPSLGLDDGDATLAGAEGAAVGMVAACGGGSCGSAVVAATFGGGTTLGGATLLAGTLIGGTMMAEDFSAGG
jgi:hypothetical protein